MGLSLEWTFLILLAASMHAGWNVLVKSSSDALVNMTLIVIVAGIIALCAVPFVSFPGPPSWPFLAWSIAAHMGYYIFLLLGYRYGDLSLVYPIARGSAPMLVAISAWAFIGEALSLMAMIGVGAISLGILSLTLDRSSNRILDQSLPRHGRLRPILFGFLTGLSIMTYSLCDGQGVRASGDEWGYIVWLFIFDAPLLLFVCFMRRGVGLFQAACLKWRIALLGGSLSMAAYAIAIYAMAKTGLAQVVALRETSVIFAAIFSTVILKESLSARRYGAAILVGLGAVVLHF